MGGRIAFAGFCVGAMLAVLPGFAAEADEPPIREGTEVVLRSLDARLRIGDRIIDTHQQLLRSRVVRVQGDDLFLTAPGGQRGWAKRQDLVPFDQAAAYFSANIARQPGSAQAYRLRGLVRFLEQNYDAAIADATQAIQLDPAFALAYADRCDARLEKYDFQGAMADANEAVRLGPSLPHGYFRRALVRQQKGEYQPSIDDFAAAIRLDPTYGSLFFHRAYSWSKLQDVDRAIADYSEAVRLDPGRGDAYFNRGNLWARKNDFRRALADLTEAIRFEPGKPMFLVARANAWAKLNDYEHAIADCDAAIRLAPTLAAARSFRGYLLEKTGKSSNAQVEFDAAAKLARGDSDTLLSRAAATFGSVDSARSLRELDEIIRLDPKNAAAYGMRSMIRASGPDAGLRDGRKALQDALKAYELCDQNDPAIYTILAAAYAEAGDFALALKWQAKAVAAATSEEERTDLEETLALFKARKPFRLATPGR